MPFLYDSASDMNMLQSGLYSPDYSARNRNAGQVQQQIQAEFAQNEAAWQSVGTMVGGVAGRAGTAAAGGNPNDPGSLGQGYFNTKASSYFQTQRNDALKAELAKQNIADAALAGRPAGTTISTFGDRPTDGSLSVARTATPAPPKTLSGMIDAAGGKGGGMRLLERAAASQAAKPSFLDQVKQVAGDALQGIAAMNVPHYPGKTPDPVESNMPHYPGKTPDPVESNMPHFLGGAPTILPSPSTVATTTAFAGNIPAINEAAQTAVAAQSAGAAVQSTGAGVAAATHAVQAAQADYAAARDNYGPDSPEAEAARSRVIDAQSDATEAVRVHQGSTEVASMATARRSGNATAVYDNGTTSINLVNHMGQPVLVATVGGQTFEIDDATADAITGLNADYENLTNSQLKRNMVMEEYERATFDRSMQEQLNQGMNEFVYQAWMEDPYNKRDENWEAAEAELMRIRPMLKYMEPGEFMQVLQDITEVARMGDPDITKSSKHIRDVRLAEKRIIVNGEKRKANGNTIRSFRIEGMKIDEEIASTTEKLAKAIELEVGMSGSDTSPAITKLDERLADLGARRKAAAGDLESAEARGAINTAEFLAMYEPDLGTDNLLVFADDFSNQSPIENIIRSVLFENGLYDPKTKTVNVDELASMDESVMMGYVREFESKAERLGWASTPGADDMWLQHLQHAGADVDMERIAEVIQQREEYQQQQQQQQQTTTQGGAFDTSGMERLKEVPPTVDVNTLRLEDVAEGTNNDGLNSIGDLKPTLDKALSGEALSNEEYRILAQNILIYLKRKNVSQEDAMYLIEKKWNLQVGKTPGTPQGHYPRQVM